MSEETWDFLDNDGAAEQVNPYLDPKKPQKGMKLVGSLLARNKSGIKAVDKLSAMIDGTIMPHIDILGEAEHEVFGILRRVKIRLTEINKSEVLAKHAVLGVGGKFSAGKSCFINSITDAGLPVDLRPTTSIATYIVKADVSSKQAVTKSDMKVDLDDEAVEALSHEFYRTYHFGFSGIIENLIINSSDFRYPEIAILDTPGYSKPDEGKDADATDKSLALSQLSSADALIWLIDIQNGTITDSDFTFIESLGTDVKILFVFNKADLIPRENAEEILNKARDTLASRPNIDVFDVIAYNSFDGETVIGGDALARFMNYVCELSKGKSSVTDDVRRAKELSLSDLENQKKELAARAKRCEDILERIYYPLHAESLVNEMARCREKIMRLDAVHNELKSAYTKLINRMNSVMRKRDKDEK